MKVWRFGLIALAAALIGLAGEGPRPYAHTTHLAAPSAARAARIPFTRAEVDRPDGRVFTIAWSASPAAGAVDVYARASPGSDGADGAGHRVAHGPATGRATIAGLPPAVRWYFELRPAHGAALVVADRSLHLATAPNFRDVGGYRTRDGRWVRMGVAYRSDQLDRLSDADLARIARLAPSLVVDLRTEAERRKGPDRTPPGAESLVADVLADAPPDMMALGGADSSQSAADFLVAANRQFVSLPSAKAAYSRLFSRAQAATAPVVYHCSAGKDRTGWATAVLLTALGVPRATVMADYLASNGYLVEKNRALVAAMPPQTAARLAPALTVRAAYLDAAFDEVDRRYGSFDRYLRDGLGLDGRALARLRARFLAGSPQG